MMVIMPLSDPRKTVSILSKRHLDEQGPVILEVLDSLHEVHPAPPWQDEAACRMWRGHEVHLALHGQEIYARIMRFRELTLEDRERSANLHTHFEWATSGNYTLAYPSWLYDRDYLLAQRAFCMREDADHYGPIFGWKIDRDLPLVWPKV